MLDRVGSREPGGSTFIPMPMRNSRQEWVLRVMVDGDRSVLEPSQGVFITRGTPHLFRNGHDGETLLTNRFTPGCGFLRFFSTWR